MRTAGKADSPRVIPAKPFSMRWMLVGPSGIRINEATKSAAVTIETFGSSAISVFLVRT